MPGNVSSEKEMKTTYFQRALALEFICSTMRTEFLPSQRIPSRQNMKSVHFFFGKHFPKSLRKQKKLLQHQSSVIYCHQ